MATTLFHWTLHPWAIYAVVGIAIAYGTFRRGRSQLISSAFTPLLGETRRRPGRPGHRHPGDLRDAVRLGGLARPRCAADRQRPRDPRRHRQGRQRRAGRHHRRADRCVRRVGRLRCRQGHPVAVQHQHGAGARAGAVRLRGRPDDLHPRPGADRGRLLLPGPGEMSARTEAAGGDAMASGCPAGRSSTGPGGSRGRRSSACSSPASAAAAPSGSSSPACCWCRAWSAWSGSRSSAARRSTSSAAHRHRRRGQRRGPAVRRCSTSAARHGHRVLVMVLVAIFFVSGADAASIVMGTLSERGTLEPSRPVVVFWGVVTGARRRGDAARRRRGRADRAAELTIVAALPFVLVMVGLAVALVKDLRSDPLIVRGAVRRGGGRAGRRRGRHRARRRLLTHHRAVRARRGRRRPGADALMVHGDATPRVAILPSSAQVLPHREPLNRCTTEPTHPWSHASRSLRCNGSGRRCHARPSRGA